MHPQLQAVPENKNYKTYYYRSTRVRVLTISKYFLSVSNNFIGVSHSILLYLGLSWFFFDYLGLCWCISVYVVASLSISVYLNLS